MRAEELQEHLLQLEYEDAMVLEATNQYFVMSQS